MARQRLDNRRGCETIEFTHTGFRYTLSFGRFHDGLGRGNLPFLAQAGLPD
jgi:hypothetical protein